MLSVGREINIASKRFLCRECPWEGVGPELSTGLVRISNSDIYLYSYRCPECGSYEIASKGKLLAFVSRFRPTATEPIQENDADEATATRVSTKNTTREGGRAGRFS